jgi:hypothetical protein
MTKYAVVEKYFDSGMCKVFVEPCFGTEPTVEQKKFCDVYREFFDTLAGAEERCRFVHWEQRRLNPER